MDPRRWVALALSLRQHSSLGQGSVEEHLGEEQIVAVTAQEAIGTNQSADDEHQSQIADENAHSVLQTTDDVVVDSVLPIRVRFEKIFEGFSKEYKGLKGIF